MTITGALRAWLAEGRPEREHGNPIGQWINTSKDPYGALIEWQRRPGYQNRLLLGAGQDGPYWSRRDESVLVLGPPGSLKTSALVATLTLSTPGPVLVTSTKVDVAIATAQSRSRLGDVWFFSPTEPTPPGFRQLRWSPVGSALNWDRAKVLALDLMQTADMRATGGDGTHQHFVDRAASFIAGVLHFAALKELDIDFVVKTITRMRSPEELSTFIVELEELGATRAADAMASVIMTDARERSGIMSSASRAISIYDSQKVLDASLNSNFDPATFVAGNPLPTGLYSHDGHRQVGRADTVYLAVPLKTMIQPVVVALINEIRLAAYELHRQDEWAGNYSRLPVTLVLDELANIAPLPDLAELVSVGRQGVMVAASLQDMSQARTRWQGDAEGFLTNFQNVMVLPGIRDMKTLEDLSKLCGDFDRRIVQNEAGAHWSRQARLSPSVISRGNPHAPDSALTIRRVWPPPGFHWTTMMPYWRNPSWLRILLSNAARVAVEGTEDQNRLPLPDLSRDGNSHMLNALGPSLTERWLQLQERHKRIGGTGDSDRTAVVRRM